MEIRRFDIWIADLNPHIGTEPGMTRPVLVVQTDLLNRAGHPSTVVCPITTRILEESEILRVHLKKGTAGMKEDCDIMMDQVRAIDNRRMVKKVGSLPGVLSERVRENLLIILDL